MNTYRVTVTPNSNAFQSIIRDIEFELLSSTETEEVYEVRSERDIETAFNQSGVISYEIL